MVMEKTLSGTGLNTDNTIVVLDAVASPDGAVYIGSRSNQTSFSNYQTELVNEATNWNTLASTSEGETLLPFSQEAFTINTTNWTGTTNSDWSISGNWDNGVPSSSSLVSIPEVTNAPEITTSIDATVGNLSITEADGLSVLGGSLTISGNLTINTGSSLYLESTITGANTIDAASVILGGTYTSDANQFFYFTETFNDNTSGWTLISSPTNGEVIDGGATGFAGFNALQTNGSNYGIAPYDNAVIAANRWDYYTTTEIAATNNVVMTSGKGYSVLPNSAIAEKEKGRLGFKGAVTTTDVAIAITDNSGGVGNDFNLIGNPFPSFIPFNTTANATNLLTANTGELAEETIWLWDKATSTYITVNQTTTIGTGTNQRPSLYIAPTQGFFVKAKTGGGTFSFTESMQSHQNSGTYNKAQNTRPEIELNITQNEVSKKTVVYYYENKTTDFDNGYDSSIFGGVNTSFSLYTKLVSGSQEKNLAIQSLPNSNYETMVIPVGIKAVADSELTFSANSLNLPNNIKVFLEDRLTNTYTLLDESNSEYTITPKESLNGTGRFYLHTKSSSVLNTDSEFLSNVNIFNTNNSLKIVGLNQGKASLSLFNILGKKVMDTSFESTTSNTISLPNLSTGVYIVKLQTLEGKVTKKIVLE